MYSFHTSGECRQPDS